MKVTIENASPGARGIWEAELDRQSLRRLANPIHQGGQLSVAMVSSPKYDSANRSLQFDLESVILLNMGDSSETLLLDARGAQPQQQTVRRKIHVRENVTGDNHFINELKRVPSIKEIGENLLADVRKEFPGELVFHPTTRKFVESPDNFWVVRVQPRAQSLRIIIYGRPELHENYESIELKRDMASYSSFILDNKQQLEDAISVIRDAKRLKDIR